MFPPRLPKLPQSWARNLPAGIDKEAPDEKIFNGQKKRPDWKNAETLKGEIIANYERSGLIYTDPNGKQTYWCVGCGQFYPVEGVNAQIEHCNEWSHIKKQLIDDAKTSSERAKYPGGGEDYFVQVGQNFQPTSFAFYAYYHDMENLTIMCAECNTKKNGVNCINYPTFLSTGSATASSRILFSDIFAEKGIDVSSASETTINSAGQEIGWADFVFLLFQDYPKARFHINRRREIQESFYSMNLVSAATTITPELIAQQIHAGGDIAVLDQPRTSTKRTRKERELSENQQNSIVQAATLRRRDSDPGSGLTTFSLVLNRMLEMERQNKRRRMENEGQ